MSPSQLRNQNIGLESELETAEHKRRQERSVPTSRPVNLESLIVGGPGLTIHLLEAVEVPMFPYLFLFFSCGPPQTSTYAGKR
jgi:hypothetical protein